MISILHVIVWYPSREIGLNCFDYDLMFLYVKLLSQIQTFRLKCLIGIFSYMVSTKKTIRLNCLNYALFLTCKFWVSIQAPLRLIQSLKHIAFSQIKCSTIKLSIISLLHKAALLSGTFRELYYGQ